MTEAPPEKAPAPWYRNPWLLGFLAGIAWITIVRFAGWTQHVPDEPEAMGAAADVALVASDGSTIDSDFLRGRVWIVGAVRPGCEAPCAEVPQALATLAARNATYDRAAGVLLVQAGGALADEAAKLHATAPTLWVAGGETGAIEAFLQGMETGFVSGDARPDLPGGGRLLLLDEQGAWRGDYGLDELGRDEVYHRAQHVVREAKKRGTLRGT